jgi:transcription elongation factor GreA
MSGHGAYLTREGHEKLRKKLEHLTKVRRKEIIVDLKRAREHGDFSENAEYDSAKDAQALNEKMIAELQRDLASAQILDDKKIARDKVLLGATVKLKDMVLEKELEYMVVSELEADFSRGRISVTSPIGRGLLGKKENEEVEIQAPANVLKYKILKISR